MQSIVEKLPEFAEKIAAPLGKAEKIVYVTGPKTRNPRTGQVVPLESEPATVGTAAFAGALAGGIVGGYSGALVAANASATAAYAKRQDAAVQSQLQEGASGALVGAITGGMFAGPEGAAVGAHLGASEGRGLPWCLSGPPTYGVTQQKFVRF